MPLTADAMAEAFMTWLTAEGLLRDGTVSATEGEVHWLARAFDAGARHGIASAG